MTLSSPSPHDGFRVRLYNRLAVGHVLEHSSSGTLAFPRSSSHVLLDSFHLQIGYRGSDDGSFNRPSAVAVTRADNVFVADSGNNRCQMLSLATGDHLWSVDGVEGESFSKPFAVGVASDSDLLIVDERGMVCVCTVRGSRRCSGRCMCACVQVWATRNPLLSRCAADFTVLVRRLDSCRWFRRQ